MTLARSVMGVGRLEGKMKNYTQGREWGELLCSDVERGLASTKRIITLAKKKLSDYEQGKVDACVDWLHRNRRRVK